MADEATTEGKHLIARWLSARETERRLRAELNRAQCECFNAEQDLAKWMLPADAAPGEKIALWHGDSLFQVEVGNNAPPHDHKVTVRTRGKHFHELSRVA